MLNFSDLFRTRKGITEGYPHEARDFSPLIAQRKGFCSKLGENLVEWRFSTSSAHAHQNQAMNCSQNPRY